MKEKIYIIFKNNEEEYDDYSDWIIEIYKDKEKAENRFVELVKTNQYKKDRAIKSAKYNEDIGAYRIEEHEIENETNKVIDTNASSIEENIKKQKESLRNWLAMHVLIKENSYMRFNYEDCWNLYKFVENALIKSDDYKRVLKENEKYKRLSRMNLKNAEEFKNNMCEHRCLLKSENEELKQENEKLRQDNIDYKRILDLADNRTYRKKYLEERRKEQPDLLYPDADEIYRRYYELKKENKELKETLKDTQNSWFEDTKKIEKLKKENQCYINSIQSIVPVLTQDYIEKQKIKEVIKELEDNICRIKKQYSNGGENCNTAYLENLAQVKILKQILKESEEK